MAPRNGYVPGRNVHSSEFGSCKSPSGRIVRQVFPLNHESQFWVTECGVAFEKRRSNGIFQWANGGEPVRLPCRMTPIWAIALAWTEPPDVDTHRTLRPVKIDGESSLSPSSVGWKISNSHIKPLLRVDNPVSDTQEPVWTALCSLPVYIHADGRCERIKLTPGEYAITSIGTLRCRNNAMVHALRTHLLGRPYRVALPEGSAFIKDIFTVGAHHRIGMRSSRHEQVYKCIVNKGSIDTTCIRNAIGSMGNEQTIHTAVFQCLKVRQPHEICSAFIRATTGKLTRSICLDVMRSNPEASVATIVSQMHSPEPTWQLYAEVRIACELVRKFEFDPPECWESDEGGVRVESVPGS